MLRTSLRSLWILVTVLASLFAFGCGKEKRVGVVLPLTGEYQVYGEASRRGIEMARQELLAANGDTAAFRVDFADSASDPEKARRLAGELYDQGALAVIGGVTADALAVMAPVAEERERVLLSPSASVNGSGRHVFSLAPSNSTAGSTLATFVARELGVRTAVLVGDAACIAQGIEEGFRAALATQGGELTATVAVPAAPAALADAIARAVSGEPDAVLLAGYEADVGAWIAELRRQGYAGKILTTQAFASPSSIRRLGAGAAGVLLASTAFLPEDERVAGFVERYRERYGEAPSVFAAEGYDAMKVLATALAGRPPLASEVRKGLIHEIKDFPGVTGALQFDEAGSVHKIPRVYSVAADLTLRDHGKWLEAERDRLEKEREKILAELKKIRAQDQASSM